LCRTTVRPDADGLSDRSLKSKMKPTLPRDYFDRLYQSDADPWNFATKDYEHQKYAATLDNLPRERYQNALELGCSIGVLTQMLAARVDSLLAVDAAQIAVDAARARCAALANVQVKRATLPDEFPDGQFDLILMSEVGYYFALPDLKQLSERVLSGLQSGGDLVLVHYLPDVPDYPLRGDDVHDFFLDLAGLNHLSGLRAERYRLDCFRRV